MIYIIANGQQNVMVFLGQIDWTQLKNVTKNIET